MTTSGPRFHIPFPTNYLALNTRPSKVAGEPVASPESDVPAHGFLSNRQIVPRHSSISSVSSSNSATSITDSPATQSVDASPVVKQETPTFLALNSKFAAPTAAPRASLDKNPFLSNTH